jgi:phage-related protein
MSDLNYVASYGTELMDQPRVQRAEFGDGYVAEAPDGINPVKEVWNVLFDTISLADGEAIRAFLRTKTGSTFTWTNPNGVEKRYRQAGELKMPRKGPNTVSLTVVFEEAFV